MATVVKILSMVKAADATAHDGKYLLTFNGVTLTSTATKAAALQFATPADALKNWLTQGGTHLGPRPTGWIRLEQNP